MATEPKIIADAIAKEQEAQRLYSSAAKQSQNALARTLLESLAEDERGHEEILRNADWEKLAPQDAPEWQDLHITNVLKDTELATNATFQEVLIFAAKREEAARKTYEALANSADNPAAKSLFERLAADEKGHKFRLEKLYDDVVLREN